jgi:tetratricopeptide (TPR) repeat protein
VGYNLDMKANKDWLWTFVGMLIFSAIMLTINLNPVPISDDRSEDQEIIPETDHLSIAEQHIMELDLESAKETLVAALESDPDDPEVNFLLGLIFAITEPDRASGYLAKSAELDANLYDHAHKMIATVKRSDFAEDEAYRLVQIGQAIGGIGNWHLPNAAFKEAVAENPEYSEAWAYLSMSEMQLGQDPSSSLETALALNNLSISANIFYAQYLASEDRPHEGLPHIHTALEQDPENLTLIYEAGHYNAEMGNLLEAYSYYEDAILRKPDEFETWYQLANFSLNYEHQVAQIGLPAARKSLLISPNDPDALILLGRAYSQLGNPLLGVKLIDQALQISQDNINALYYLGIIHISLGKNAEAESYLYQVISLSRDQATIKQVQNIIDTFLH